ncbi:TylF/MycF family methyltransferase [Prosthecodimorpha staleyi]|uniref:TylF/MycF family methyltransferase n=1 Tax=Prosthecodimorpha staleyi TaxID=2840188 RepID=A0A947DA81_9HYPH|nr:TylF/MycF family methyltransferase [Prosthecodimorpha staleyi]MBT9293229.1 TylF/MycF family methyltransferase [Prosthecodimorpha staleyi]
MDRDEGNLLGFTRALSESERAARYELTGLFNGSPIPENERLDNLGLHMDHLALGRALFMDHLYRLILGMPGVIMELGCRWGQNLSFFLNLRTLYEPTHYSRKIIGFDTFNGFVDVAAEDGDSVYARPGNVRTTRGYDAYLERVLAAREAMAPLSHKRKFEIVTGDVRETLPRYLTAHPETIVALAYFDMDLFSPTRDALVALRPRLARGSVVVLDEINDAGFPGETTALREVFGLNGLALRRVPFLNGPGYFVVE